jgi:hypothetical protein
MTFLEYITRRTGLGRTHWFWAIVIHVGFAAFCAMGIYWLIADNEWWHIATFGIPIIGTVAFWIYTWKNWKTDKAREEAGPANPLGHHDQLWDGADYVCMHGVKPHKRTGKCAWPIAHDLSKFPNEPTAQERAIQYDL